HPRRHRVDPQGPDRGRPGAEPQGAPDLSPDHPEAGAARDLPGVDEPIHPVDAELGRRLGDLGRRPDLGRRQSAIADLPQLRDLHRRHADLPGAGAVVLGAVPIDPGPGAVVPGSPLKETGMRTFGTQDFWFILQAAQWTIGLSLIAFIGGALVGLAVAL